jgi:hypothetical protein
MDFLTVVANVFEAGPDQSLVSLLDILSEECLIFTFVERLAPLVHDFDHLTDVILHLLDELVNFGNDLHGLVDKRVNIVGVPLELSNAGVKGIQHHLNAVSEKGLLDLEKGCEHIIVHVYSELKVTGLGAVNVYFSVKIGGTLGHFDVDKLQVLDFTEQTHEDGVEVDANKAFIS